MVIKADLGNRVCNFCNKSAMVLLTFHVSIFDFAEKTDFEVKLKKFK